MALADLLTVLALAGVVAGLLLGSRQTVSAHAGAVGGGLLFGIALFWVLPEIAGAVGWPVALLCSAAAAAALALLDRHYHRHGDETERGVIWPLLGAGAIHSFLDGWSVRALSGEPITSAAVLLGLALHKVPEGMALGWIARQSFRSFSKALALGTCVELFTMAGAAVELNVSQPGKAQFGTGWTTAVLAVIAGSFLFLGLHTTMQARRTGGVIAMFLGTLVVVGCVALVQGRLGR